MAHDNRCGKPCGECVDSCALDESIPCSPDCENLLSDGIRNEKGCRKAECDAYMVINYKGIVFNDYFYSDDDDPNYNWSQICTACACEHGIYVEAAKNDCPAQIICGVLGCENEADFYLDFDGAETVTAYRTREIGDNKHV